MTMIKFIFHCKHRTKKSVDEIFRGRFWWRWVWTEILHTHTTYFNDANLRQRIPEGSMGPVANGSSWRQSIFKIIISIRLLSTKNFIRCTCARTQKQRISKVNDALTGHGSTKQKREGDATSSVKPMTDLVLVDFRALNSWRNVFVGTPPVIDIGGANRGTKIANWNGATSQWTYRS